MKARSWIPFLVAAAAMLPGVALRLTGVHLGPPLTAMTAGAAILGASFLLLWACEAAQADVSQALALAAVALIAVLPEYAVDMYFTWQAGRHPDAEYAHYAVANMTGANRLLIGVAWGLIALLYWARHRQTVHIVAERRLELLFLGLATAYAFVIPIKGTLAWYDGVVFLGIYAAYVVLASRRPCTEVEAEGPAEALLALPKGRRRALTVLLFACAGGGILASAEPFCEGLVATGKLLQVNEFLLVQWLAPIASEAPEFVVALVFAWRGRASLALGGLLSSKLNQWTLLVGMIPGVYALSSGSLAQPMPMGELQMREILLTAAQSLMAVVMLASLRLPLREALLLFAMFAGQLLMPGVVRAFPGAGFGLRPEHVHTFFAALYLMGALTLFLQQPRNIWNLWTGWHTPPADRPDAAGAAEDLKSPHCLKCRWRLAGTPALPSEAKVDA